MFASFQSFGTVPESIDCWKKWVMTSDNSTASSFRMRGWIAPGQKFVGDDDFQKVDDSLLADFDI